ncbi:MAG: AsmA family protein [Francisellaceae bacterium]
MKKILSLLLALLVLAILCIGIWFLFFFDVNHYKSQISSGIEAKTGIKLDIKGNLNWHLFPPRLTVSDVSLDRDKLSSNWKEIDIKTTFWKLIMGERIPINRLELHKGTLMINNTNPILIEKLTLDQQQNQTFILKGKASDNGREINVSTDINVNEALKQLVFTNVDIESKVGENALKLKAMGFVYDIDANDLEIPYFDVFIGDQRLKGQLKIKSFNPLNLLMNLKSADLAVDKIVKLQGLKLNLHNFTVDLSMTKNQKLAGILDISSDSSELQGIDLNELSVSLQKLLHSLTKADGIGGAFQQLKRKLMPMMSSSGFKADPNKKTLFDELLIHTLFEDNHFNTDVINWQSKQFYITGSGSGQLSPLTADYKLAMHLTGNTSFIIPYQARYENHQFEGKIEQDELESQINPVIRQALKQELAKRIGSIFG